MTIFPVHIIKLLVCYILEIVTEMSNSNKVTGTPTGSVLFDLYSLMTSTEHCYQVTIYRSYACIALSGCGLISQTSYFP